MFSNLTRVLQTQFNSKFTRIGICLLLAGCMADNGGSEFQIGQTELPEGAFVIPATEEWVNSEIHVSAGESITVTAQGHVQINDGTNCNCHGTEGVVGPAGSYLFSDEVAEKNFPLPTAVRGPAPGYCLIAKIGEGEPFYVGEQKSWVATESGDLFLGINDFDVSDNQGQFYAQIVKDETIRPVSFEQVVPSDVVAGRPVVGSSVVVFYMDGLRPDVIREMAAMGHIPNINELFLERGTWMKNCFTAFPSDTITSNGTMWTGCFSDRHGLKGQVRFSRKKLQSQSYLDPLGPKRSSSLLAPKGLDLLARETQASSVELIHGKAAAETFRQVHTTWVPPINEYLKVHGQNWATGILPLMTDVPPPLWTRSLSRHMPYPSTQKAWRYIDDANTHYAVRHLLDQRDPLTIIWLPETDSCSHKNCRGQFGMTRRTIAQADRLIGETLAVLKTQNRLDDTYFLLVSDHGHQGGRTTHLKHFDIANHLFFEPRQMTVNGNWVGGGLGLSVQQHRFNNSHPEDSNREFVFIDGQSDGVVRIFFPRNSYRSGEWTGPSRPGDLLNYKIDDHLPRVNLVDFILSAQAEAKQQGTAPPVDLVLLKLTDDSILVSTADRGQAVIKRKRNAQQNWVYKYTLVEEVRPAADGGIIYEENTMPLVDPFGLLRHLSEQQLGYYHDEQSWLRLTAKTKYPDCIVAISRHLLWQDHLKAREREYSADLVVTARHGWYFGRKSSPGTMHGYPLADSMRASFFISGPNVRHGARVEEPCRLVDLTPTILSITQKHPVPNDFDGRILQSMFRPENTDPDTIIRPVFWDEVDLRGWNQIEYQPMDEYHLMPFTVNRPDSAWDLNNMTYNALSVSKWNPLFIFDELISPLSGNSRTTTLAIERYDRKVRDQSPSWMSEGTRAIDAPGIAISDYSLFSGGNLKRADRAVDWLQNRSRTAHQKAARAIGRNAIPGSWVVHKAVDTTQAGFWDAYSFAQRIGMEVLDEKILNGLENTTDKMVNSFREIPAEVIVQERPLNENVLPAPLKNPSPRKIAREQSPTEEKSKTLFPVKFEE